MIKIHKIIQCLTYIFAATTLAALIISNATDSVYAKFFCTVSAALWGITMVWMFINETAKTKARKRNRYYHPEEYFNSEEPIETDLEVVEDEKADLEEKLFEIRSDIWNKRLDRVYFRQSEESAYRSRLKWKSGYYRETKSALNFLLASFILDVVFNTIAIHTYFDSILTMTPDTSPLICHLAGFLTCLTLWALISTNVYYKKEKTELKSISFESFLTREYKIYADNIKELQAKASGIRANIKANDAVILKLKSEIIKRNEAILND